MFISIKKYLQLLKALQMLVNRPYLQAIRDNGDGTITFEFVQDGKVYIFIAERIDLEERILN
jgi:hypothetical protein